MAISVDDSWRWDCHFQSAEVLTGTDPIGSYDIIAALCQSSGEFAGRCVDKVNSHLALLAPPSNAPAASWTPALRAAEVMQNT